LSAPGQVPKRSGTVAVAKIVFVFCWQRFVDYGDDLVGSDAS
jgi:hypothetical protein